MPRKMERELRLGMMTSRRSLMEREKAMTAARNPGVSKFGDCLVSINSKTDRLLTSNIRRINSEIKRMQLQINHKMKHFVKHSAVLNHDPLILVERPASPDVVKRAQTMTQYENLDQHGFPPSSVEDENRPSFMRQLRSRAKTPSTLTTIDAFTVKARKKKNVWEGAVDDKRPPQFQSTVRPSAKLTRREVTDLRKGYDFHKPKIEHNGGSHSDTEDTSNENNKALVLPTPTKKVKQRRRRDSDDDSDFDETIGPFITQMASVKSGASATEPQDAQAKYSLFIRKSPTGMKSPSTGQLVRNDKIVRFNSAVRAKSGNSAITKRRTQTAKTVVLY